MITLIKKVLLCVVLLLILAVPAWAATITESFVWSASELGTTWRNFGYTGVTGIVKVANHPPTGDNRGYIGRIYEEFTLNTDYQISGDTIKLIANSKTNTYGYPDNYLNSEDPDYGTATYPWQIWVTYTIAGDAYAPASSVAEANALKMPNWLSALEHKDDLSIFVFGDSTTFQQVTNFVDMWECRWAMDLLAKYPRISRVYINFLGIGGTVSDDVNFHNFNPATTNSVPWLINNAVKGVTVSRSTTTGNFQTDYDSNSVGRVPDIILVTFINDCAKPWNPAPAFAQNFTDFRNWIRGTKGWTNTEYVLIPGLVSDYTVWHENMRLGEISLAASLPDTVCVDVSTVWENLFARKTYLDILTNTVNHANTYSAIAYTVEMGAIFLPIPPIPQEHIAGGGTIKKTDGSDGGSRRRKDGSIWVP